MARLNLLVTGFGPFPGMPLNPSAAVTRLVAADRRWIRRGVAATAVVLPTTYAAVDGDLAPALRGMDAVLMIGVSGRSRRIRVEGRATGRASALLPDASGSRFERAARSGAGAARRTTVAVPAVLAVLRRAGLPSRPSRDAGRYLCDAAYFRALAEPVPVLFVHIPKPPRRDRPRRSGPSRPTPWLPQVAAALALVAGDLLLRTRRGGVETET